MAGGLLALAFAFAVVVTLLAMSGSDAVLLLGLPAPGCWLLAGPPVLALLAAAIVGSALLAWRRGWWGAPERLIYSLAGLAAVAVVVALNDLALLLPLLGWRG
jgi:hypothetical protein